MIVAYLIAHKNNMHDLITTGMIVWPLMVLAFIATYLVFFRDTEKPHKEKHPHR